MASGDMSTSQPVPSEFEPYLSDAAKLRRLARGLIDDMHVVEDAVHAALAASAHRQYRDEAHRSRSLWASVRNAINDHRRSSANRVARERVAARPEAAPAADESLHRIETSKLVLEELGQLDEVYRSVLTRHYLQDLSPKAIATQDGVDLNTVHRRIQRGRELLRERLERRAGGRENLLGLLVPFAGAPRAGLLRSLRDVAQSSPAVWAAAVIVSVGLGLLFWLTPEVIELRTAAAPSSSSLLASTSEASAQDSRDSARAAVESEQRVELRVVTGSGAQRVADAAVTWWPLSQRPNAAKEVEYWFQNNILEDRIRDGAVEHTADTNGVAQLPWSSTGFVAIASKGSLWGYSVVPASQRGPALLELVEDWDLEMFVHDQEVRPLEGMIVSLAAIPYLGQSEIFQSQLTDQLGKAKLRHFGAVRNSPSNPRVGSAYVTVGVCGSTHERVYELTPADLQDRKIDVTWASAVAQFDVRVVDDPPGPSTHRFVLSIDNVDEEWISVTTINGSTRLAVSPSRPGFLGWDRSELRLLNSAESPASFVPLEIVPMVFGVVDATSAEQVGQHWTVVGRVVDREGRPLEGRSFRVNCACGDYLHAKTGFDGAFEVRMPSCDMQGNGCSILFRSADAAQGSETIHTFVPESGHSLDVGELRSSLVSLSVRGRVVDSRSSPVSGATVTLACFEPDSLSSWFGPRRINVRVSRSEKHGTFEIALDWPAESRVAEMPLLVSHPDFGQFVGIARPGQQDVVAQLPSARTVSGRVLLDPSISNSDIWIEASPFEWARSGNAGKVWTTHEDFASLGRLVRVDRDGGFVLLGLGDATLNLTVVHHGMVLGSDPPDALHSIRVDLSGSETEVRLPDIDLRSAFCRTSFTFVDKRDRAPVSGIRIAFRSADAPEFYASARSDSRGRASLLTPTGATAFIESNEFYADEVECTGTVRIISLERRPTLEFQLEGAPPVLDEGVALAVRIRAPGNVEPVSEVTLEGLALRAPAPDRHHAELAVVVQTNGDSEPCTAPQVIDLVPGQTEPYLVKAPTQAEVDAAVRVLRSR